jgi:metal-dependent amidase/aminoacylase/carboxypeptidase family protein
MTVQYPQEIRALQSDLQRIRRELHRHPELAFREEGTAALVCRELQGLGLEVRTGVGKTGVVATLRGRQPGKTLLVRVDMDALPIHEQSQVDYRSQNPGVMHA